MRLAYGIAWFTMGAGAALILNSLLIVPAITERFCTPVVVYHESLEPECPKVIAGSMLTYEYIESPSHLGPWRMNCHYAEKPRWPGKRAAYP